MRLRDVAMKHAEWINLEELKQPGMRRLLEAFGRIRSEFSSLDEDNIEARFDDFLLDDNMTLSVEPRAKFGKRRYVRFPSAGSTDRCNTCVKSLCWSFELQSLTWSFVYLLLDFYSGATELKPPSFSRPTLPCIRIAVRPAIISQAIMPYRHAAPLPCH